MRLTQAQAQASDAEIASTWAIEALQQGRFELGSALARIAVQANRIAAARIREVPYIGQTREEQPIRPAAPAEPALYGIPHANDAPAHDTSETALLDYVVSVGDPARVQEQVEAAATEVFGRPLTVDGLPDARRCVAGVRRDGILDECRVPVFWRPGVIGGPGVPSYQARWHHVDPNMDTDHDPVIVVV